MGILTKNKLQKIFDDFRQKKIMVIGDVMLDSYFWGSVKRISPEAPVPVVLLNKRETRLGGAANVALNLKKLGANPFLFSVMGTDTEGDKLLRLLKENEISPEYVLCNPDRPTTVKTRIIANNLQQLIRIDSETEENINESENDTLKAMFIKELGSFDAIIFEDYDKGVLSEDLITFIIQEANKKKIPTIVDPKKKNFFAYRQATLFKPNLRELKEGLGIVFSKPATEHELKSAIEWLIQRAEIKNVLVTLADEGIFIGDIHDYSHVPTHKRSIYDVSGAGDTVAATAALALSCNLNNRVIAELANIAGGLVCEKVGVAPIEKEIFFNECLKLLC